MWLRASYDGYGSKTARPLDRRLLLIGGDCRERISAYGPIRDVESFERISLHSMCVRPLLVFFLFAPHEIQANRVSRKNPLRPLTHTRRH